MQDAIPLTLEHQALFAPAWQALCLEHQLQFAEYSFSNAFLYRRQHEYVVIEGEIPFIRGQFDQGGYYMIPPYFPDKRLIAIAHQQDLSLFPIPENWLPLLQSQGTSVASNEADSDYLFTTEKFKTLKGRALSSRRNLLHQLEAHYTLSSRHLADTDLPLAFDLLDKWQANASLPKEKTDYVSCREALEHRERLGMCGCMSYGDGVPIGFTMGELLTPSTAVLHFSKADPNIKGATPYLYQQFAHHLPETVEWIDLEQDLGIDALRQAKRAYDPDRLLTKWRVRFTQ